MPEPVKPLSEPPVAVTSATVKSVADSERVNVIVAVWPILSTDLSLEIVIDGASVSVSLRLKLPLALNLTTKISVLPLLLTVVEPNVPA